MFVVGVRQPQRLIGVDVADAGDERLVEEGTLHGGVLRLQSAGDGFHPEVGVEGVERDVSNGFG